MTPISISIMMIFYLFNKRLRNIWDIIRMLGNKRLHGKMLA